LPAAGGPARVGSLRDPAISSHADATLDTGSGPLDADTGYVICGQFRQSGDYGGAADHARDPERIDHRRRSVGGGLRLANPHPASALDRWHPTGIARSFQPRAWIYQWRRGVGAITQRLP